MKILLNHSFPEKKEAFSSDEANYVLKNLKDWKIVSFSKFKIESNDNVVYLDIFSGILSYVFSSKINFIKKIKILKMVFDGDFKNILRNLQSLFLAFSFIQKINLEEIELIYSYWFTRPTIIAYYLNYLFGTKFVIHGHGSDLYVYPPNNLKDILDKADGVMTVSSANKKYIEDKYKINSKKIKIFRLGAQKDKKVEVKEYEKRKNKMVYIGRFEKIKGIDILMESLNKIKNDLEKNNYVVEIYGAGKLENYIKKFIQDKDLEKKVVLKGWINQNEIMRVMNESKLTLLSSYSEGLPVVLMQAISVGTPIVANDVGGVREIVTGETGILNLEIKSEAFSQSITKFLNLNEIEKQKISENCLKLFEEEYDLENNLKKKYEWLKNLK